MNTTPLIPERPCLLQSHFEGGRFGAPVIDVYPRMPLTAEQIEQVRQSLGGKILYVVHADDAGPDDFHPETLELAMATGHHVLWQPHMLPAPLCLPVAAEVEGANKATIFVIRADQGLRWVSHLLHRPPQTTVRLLFPNPKPAVGHGDERRLLH